MDYSNSSCLAEKAWDFVCLGKLYGRPSNIFWRTLENKVESAAGES